jgi:tripeptide aminopeptidase
MEGSSSREVSEYVKFDTKSDEESGVTPSTEGQRVLAEEYSKKIKYNGY